MCPVHNDDIFYAVDVETVEKYNFQNLKDVNYLYKVTLGLLMLKSKTS